MSDNTPAAQTYHLPVNQTSGVSETLEVFSQ